MTGREGKETVKQLMKKIILSLGLLLAFAAAMFILKHELIIRIKEWNLWDV